MGGNEKMKDTLYILLTMLMVLFLIVYFVHAGVSLLVQQRCLRQGYADSKVTWTFEGYCIREENEYEIVVPLRELQ
jgi:hypothetical protein